MAKDTVPPEEPSQDEPSQTLESTQAAKQECAAVLVTLLHTILLHTMRAAELLERALQPRGPDDLAEVERYLKAHKIGEDDVGLPSD
jgi:hypothetical protein